MTQDMARQVEANDIDVSDDLGRDLISAVTTTTTAAHQRHPCRTRACGPPALIGVMLSADDGDTAEGTLGFTWDPNATAIQPGRVNLKETGPAVAPGDGGAVTAPSLGGGSGNGTSWVLLTAVAIGMFVAGSGTTFLLIQKRS
jgi:hypothetical protein